MTTKALEKALSITRVPGGYSSPGGYYDDRKWTILQEWAQRQDQKTVNRLRYERRYRRGRR